MTLAEIRTGLARVGALRAEQRRQLEQAYVELLGTPAGEEADRLTGKVAELRRQGELLKAQGLFNFASDIDPRQFVSQLDGSIPILMMPLRIQTRFQNAGNGRLLLIRVYPDDISVERHEPRLSAAERAAGEQFWAAVDGATQRGIWRGIATRFNLRRAAWIIKASAPGAVADDPLDVPVRVPAAWTLPERLVFRLYVGKDPERLAGEFLGQPIPDGLEMGIDPTAPNLGFDRAGGNLEYPSELRWQTDFSEAARMGMAIVLPLTQLGIPDTITRVVVVGVRMATDETASAALVEQLIAGHRYTDGFSIVPQGTPTNVTNDADAPPLPDVDATLDRLTGPGAYRDDGLGVRYEAECDGLRLAHALGIAPEVLRYVEHADQEDGREAIAMKRALWAGTFGYYAQHMLAPLLDAGPEAPNPNRPEFLILAARFFFTHFVFARGPLPAFRVGSQPYGVLPIAADTLTAVDSPIQPWGDAPIDGFLLDLHRKMTILAKPWIALVDKVPQAGAGPNANARLLDVLATQASSVEWRSEQLVGLQYLAFAADFKNQGAADSALNAFITQIAKRLTNVKATVPGLFPFTPRVLQLSFLGGFWHTIVDQLGQQVKKIERSLTPPLTGDVIDNQPYSETRGIDPAYPNYIDWLSRTAFDDVRRGLTRTDAEGAPEPVTALLYMALRHSLLYEHAFLAMRLFRRFRTKTRATPYSWSDFAEKDIYNLNFVLEPTYWDYVHRADPAGWPIAGPQPIPGSVFDLVQKRDTVLATAPESKAFLGDIDETYRALQLFAPETFPTARLERLFAEHIDLAGYRLDAWLTGFVYQRLIAYRALRNLDGRPHPLQIAPLGGIQQTPLIRYDLNHHPLAPYSTGIYLGAYGWVENLHADPVPDPVDDLPPGLEPPNGGPVTRDADNFGFIHAPSLNHAVTAAVLRSASVTQSGTTAFNVDLSSTRTRDALWIVDGVRNGQSPAALLGYRFERALRDSPTPDLQQWLPQLRAAFPMPRPVDTTPGANEAIAAHDVVNGLLLIQAARANTLAATLAFSGADVAVLLAAATAIVDTFDACGDLMLAESVHQAVQGNYDRAGSVITAAGEFTHVPSEFHVTETPRSGTALSHRLVLAMDAAAAGAGDAMSSPRSRLQPELNQWIGSVIGPLNALLSTLTYSFREANGEVSEELETITVSYDQLGLEPIDLLFVADDRVASDLDRRLDLVARPQFDAARPGAQVTKIATDTTGAAAALALLDSMRALLASAKPATVRDFVAPSTLHGLTEDAIDGIDEEELLLRVLGVSRLDADARNPASLWASFEAVLARATPAAPDPAAVLIEAAAFGVREAVAAGPDLQKQLDQVQAILTARHEAALAKWTPFTPPAKDVLRVCREVTDILLGGAFPLMPRLVLPASAAAAVLPAGAPSDDQVGDWLFRVSTVRDGARGLQDLRVRAAELSTALTPMQVVQWPVENRSWIALPIAADVVLTGDLVSVAIQAAGALDLTLPIVAMTVDEWSETIPSKDETTGISFHYDAPNAEPPQAVLLAVAHGVKLPPFVQQPPLRWTWDEVVACVDQALLLAKIRCVDPDLIRKTPLDAVLPATIAAQTTFPATISTSWFGNMVKEVANAHSEILKRT